MSFQSQYAYVLEFPGQPLLIFTFPNVVKKYIRDCYTVSGELRLPPATHTKLTRYRVNPKAGRAPDIVYLSIEEFMK